MVLQVAFNFLFSWFSWLTGWFLLLSILLYLLPSIVMRLLPTPNLRTIYCEPSGNEKIWALVTGGSSGIGAALTTELCKQGINLVIIALDDDVFRNHVAQLHKQFPDTLVEPVAVDLGSQHYMDKIISATRDKNVNLVFNNAGFLRVGAFATFPIEKHMEQIEVNVNSYLKISHHFYKQWREDTQRKGARCICFTSSSAGFVFSPYSAVYGATKAFLTHFASSFALEAKHDKVHVCSFHPQYTRTSLFNRSEHLSIFPLLERFSDSPQEVAVQLIKSVGYGLARRDFGWYSVLTRILSSIWLDHNLLTLVASRALTLVPDFKKYK